jgi:uncharacterized protein YndB with AHSA1/START domain
MSVRKEASGRRSVQVEVEVAGTPEEVWRAIATGSGVSSWFVPTEVVAGENGVPSRVIAHFGPGMDSTATVTAWNPPYRFAAESRDLGPEAPPVATEWIVEARSGGSSIVRVVHSLFASTDDWDDQLAGFESGWPAFFLILRLYLSYFRDLPCSAFQLMGVARQSESEAWDLLSASLGLSGATTGQRRHTLSTAPRLAGLIEQTGEGRHAHQFLFRLDEPAAGIAHLFALTICGQVYLTIRIYLYGERASAAVEQEEPLWKKWIAERFPSAGEAGHVQ